MKHKDKGLTFRASRSLDLKSDNFVTASTPGSNYRQRCRATVGLRSVG